MRDTLKRAAKIQQRGARQLLLLTCLLLSPLSASADESLIIQPLPESADELPLSSAPVLESETIEQISDPAEFFHLSKVSLKLRNYYRDAADNAEGSDQTWAQGGSLRWRSGKYRERLSLETEIFGSAPLWVPESSDGGGLLDPKGNPYGVLGILNPRVFFEGARLSLYRQRLNYAYLNEQDSRMTPNTFQGYVLQQNQTPGVRPIFEYSLGYLEKIKPRNEERFIPMSQAIGLNNSSRGSFILGVRLNPSSETNISINDYATADTLNIFYSEASFRKKIKQSPLALQLGVQYSQQEALGNDLPANPSTGFFGLKTAMSAYGAILQLAMNKNRAGGDLLSPFGSYPAYTSRLVENFQNADAEVWMSSFAFNLSRIGVKNFTFTSAFARSTIDNDADLGGSNHKQESDFILNYRFHQGPLKDLQVQAVAALIDSDKQPQEEEFRLILNYEFLLYDGANSGLSGK